MIARIWRGWVRTEDRDAYVSYINDTGTAQPANARQPRGLDAHRDLDDGRTEIAPLSFWDSPDAICGFAGDDISRAVFYTEDDPT